MSAVFWVSPPGSEACRALHLSPSPSWDSVGVCIILSFPSSPTQGLGVPLFKRASRRLSVSWIPDLSYQTVCVSGQGPGLPRWHASFKYLRAINDSPLHM